MELFLAEAKASGSQRSEMEEAKMAIRDVDPGADPAVVAADGSGGTDAAAERSGTATPLPPPPNDAPVDGVEAKASEPAAPADGLATPPAPQIAEPEGGGALGSGTGGQSSPSFQSGGGSPAEAAAADAAAAVPGADGAAASKHPEDEDTLGSLVGQTGAAKAATRKRTKSSATGS